jgi:hypothetical protein
MKNQFAVTIGLGVLMLVSRPIAVGADAVTMWNENAAKAATAACLHVSGNALVESRTYAMVHVAVHDAVNAIERRSRPSPDLLCARGSVDRPAGPSADVFDNRRPSLSTRMPSRFGYRIFKFSLRATEADVGSIVPPLELR